VYESSVKGHAVIRTGQRGSVSNTSSSHLDFAGNSSTSSTSNNSKPPRGRQPSGGSRLERIARRVVMALTVPVLLGAAASSQADAVIASWNLKHAG